MGGGRFRTWAGEEDLGAKTLERMRNMRRKPSMLSPAAPAHLPRTIRDASLWPACCAGGRGAEARAIPCKVPPRISATKDCVQHLCWEAWDWYTSCSKHSKQPTVDQPIHHTHSSACLRMLNAMARALASTCTYQSTWASSPSKKTRIPRAEGSMPLGESCGRHTSQEHWQNRSKSRPK